MFFDLQSTGMRVLSVTDLVGSKGPVIGREHVVLRVDGATLIATLRDLDDESPDTYEGAATLEDGRGGKLVLPIVAICKDKLWWL
jgi:hypothetical protein